MANLDDNKKPDDVLNDNDADLKDDAAPGEAGDDAEDSEDLDSWELEGEMEE